MTEWGDSTDPVVVNPFADQLDARLLPWLYWSWNGHIVTDSKQPLVPPNLNVTGLAALTRPYPTVVNGTPTRLAFDPATATMDFAFATTQPDGSSDLALAPDGGHGAEAPLPDRLHGHRGRGRHHVAAVRPRGDAA